MAQMAPMNWMILSFYFLIPFMFLMLTFHFFYLLKTVKMKNTRKNFTSNLNWNFNVN